MIQTTGPWLPVKPTDPETIRDAVTAAVSAGVQQPELNQLQAFVAGADTLRLLMMHEQMAAARLRNQGMGEALIHQRQGRAVRGYWRWYLSNQTA